MTVQAHTRAPLLLAVVVLMSVIAAAGFALSGSATRRSAPQGPAASSSPICRAEQRLGRLADLPEASGLTASRREPTLLWGHNDSAAPMVYALGLDGSLRARIRVTGADIEDWEAIAAAPCPDGSCLYVGDIGDNAAARPRITLYRVPEPQSTDRATQPAEVVHVVYPDRPQDAEALFATDTGLYLVTKGDGLPVSLYRVRLPAAPGSPATLQPVAQLTPRAAPKEHRVTDAAVSPDGRWTALRTNDRLLFYQTRALTSGHPGTPLEFDLRALGEPQGEALAWPRGDTLYVAGEGAGGGTFGRVSCRLPSS